MHRILRNVCRDASAAGVFVVELLGGVVAVQQEGIAGADAAEADIAKRSIRHDSWGQENKLIDATTVDGQVIDLRLIDILKNVDFLLIDDWRRFDDLDLRGGGREL